MNIKERLNKINSDILEEIANLRAIYPTIPFYIEEDLEEHEPPIFEKRMKYSGEVIDVYLLSVQPDGFYVIDVPTLCNDTTIGVNDLISIEDKLLLLVTMQKQVDYINQFLEECGEEVYDMPISDLELKMDNHKCIKWGNKEWFIPSDSNHHIYTLLTYYNKI